MISCVTYENAHQFGGAFAAQFRLRHECFIDRQDYRVSRWRGMEYDQYDTPATTYLVASDDAGNALGCSRLTPVEQGSMLRDLWPNLVVSPDEAFAGKVWEGTRFCVKKTLPPDLRRAVLNELVVGYFEAGLAEGVTKVIGVMPPFIFRRVFIATGCCYAFLGEPAKIASGEIIVAAAIEISEAALAEVRRVTGIAHSVIERWSQPMLRAAA